MESKNSIVVYASASKADAQLAKCFLLKNGIDAFIKGERSEMVRSLLSEAIGAVSHHLTNPLFAMFGSDGQVCVSQENVPRAMTLLAEFNKRNRSTTDPEESYDPVDFIRVVCPDCNQPAFFHVSKRSRCEQCPRCKAYMDIE